MKNDGNMLKKVDNINQYASMFQIYTHNIPVIYSSLEGQYKGLLYVDDEAHPEVAILFTPFGFHFVAGNVDANQVVEKIETCIFKQYLVQSGENEAIVFCPTEAWNHVLDRVFSKHSKIVDGRKCFSLNKEKFHAIYQRTGDLEPLKQEVVISELISESANESQIEYPVCQIVKKEHRVSWCAACMIGKGHAEIDIFTDENERGKGYAKMTAMRLIKELLDRGIEPDWCTWPYRTESEKLAVSLGYELKEVVPAHIWIKEAQ